MASMGPGQLNPAPSINLMKTYVNRLLINILRSEGLSTVGVKVDFQRRIIERLTEYAHTNNVEKFNNLKMLIHHPDRALQPSLGRPQAYYVPAGATWPPPNASHFAVSGVVAPGSPQVAPPISSSRGELSPDYKQSPFYVIRKQIGPLQICNVMTSHRHTVTISVKAGDPGLAELIADPSLRIMVFCASEPAVGKTDIAFPHQSEIKVNGTEIKANLRGLKNKPGSTRPVDITSALRLRPATFDNTVEMTYALTSKKFYIQIKSVKMTKVEDLVNVLKAGRRIAIQTVTNEMIRNHDPDLQATSTVMSLKCPLSTLRIDLPVRGFQCRHNACFDATSYLQLQEQGPTWMCPICNRSATFDTLAVDDYVKNILQSTSRDTDQVTIEPDGKWCVHVKSTPTKKRRYNSGNSDDELIEIKEAKVADSQKSSLPFDSPASSIRTPVASSREPSSSAGPKSGMKRPAVIDLTLSDDDDAPLSRPTKRQFTKYDTSNNLPQRPSHD